MSVNFDVDPLIRPNEKTDKRYINEKCCEEKELARAYVPFQKIGKIYPPSESLAAGTIFPELNRPYKCKYKK